MESISGKDLLIRDLKRQMENFKCEKEAAESERDHLQYCLDEIRKSFSYRLGLACTWLPRKLRRKSGGK